MVTLRFIGHSEYAEIRDPQPHRWEWHQSGIHRASREVCFVPITNGIHWTEMSRSPFTTITAGSARYRYSTNGWSAARVSDDHVTMVHLPYERQAGVVWPPAPSANCSNGSFDAAKRPALKAAGSCRRKCWSVRIAGIGPGKYFLRW